MTPESSEFTYPRPNLIVSRKGYSVEMRMPNAILYEEGDRRMTIFAEALATAEPKIAIRRKDVKQWESPGETAPVSDRDQDRIVANIERAFEFKGWILAVE